MAVGAGAFTDTHAHALAVNTQPSFCAPPASWYMMADSMLLWLAGPGLSQGCH